MRKITLSTLQAITAVAALTLAGVLLSEAVGIQAHEFANTERQFADRLSIQRVPWRATNGIAFFHTSRNRVWLKSLGNVTSQNTGLWKVSPRSSEITPIKAALDFEIFAPADRAVWGTVLTVPQRSSSRRVVRAQSSPRTWCNSPA